MLKRTFDLFKRYRVILYLRMSDPGQNPRSPEQQEAMIRDLIHSMKLPWTVVKIYRDDGISGRLKRKRHGYQEMLADIRMRRVTADLILVDTTERFGRVEDLQPIRKELFDSEGILLLTADTRFADPTTPMGKAYSAFEAMRATEEGRIKAHQVLRGKRDLAQQGYWPGGVHPFGLQFSPDFATIKGHQEIVGNHLTPCPEQAPILKLAFAKAHETGWGQTRLAKFLTAHPDIPDKFKPFLPTTVGRWLKNPIYHGHLRWPIHSTDIIADSRVIERNNPEDVLELPGFCEPLVSKEVWDAVQDLRTKRSESIRRGREARPDERKLLRAPSPGMVLKYLLTGLVRCGECQRSMDPSSSKYTNKSGETVKYVSYVCPGYLGGVCANNRRVPEAWLRETVVAELRHRLFPDFDK